MPDEFPVACLLGPTASGKSDVAVEAARRTRGEVVCCDAFSVYRGLTLLSAAPVPPADVPHHLLALLAPHERYSAGRFLADADAAIEGIRARGRRPWLVGGTALYLRSWWKGIGAAVARDEGFRAGLAERVGREGPASLHKELVARDPVRAAEVHPHDERRLVRALEILHLTGAPPSAARSEWSGPDRVAARLVGLRRAGDDLDRRIEARTAALFAGGALAEAEAFLASSPSPEARKALGLYECEAVLRGTSSVPAARDALAQRTRRFARRQMTFFRSFEGVAWLDVPAGESAATTAERVLAALTAPPRPPAPGDVRAVGQDTSA